MPKDSPGLIQDSLSPITSSISSLRKYLADRAFITDLVTRLVITFGVVLIVGGLYLMLSGVQEYFAVQTVISAITWVPGIPFYIGTLTNNGSSVVGLISWIVGLDLLLLGLGLWVRHVFARFTALIIFLLAACFQFGEFVEVGILGSPGSIVSLLADLVLMVFLFSRFDSPKGPKNKVVPSSRLRSSQVLMEDIPQD